MQLGFSVRRLSKNLRRFPPLWRIPYSSKLILTWRSSISSGVLPTESDFGFLINSCSFDLAAVNCDRGWNVSNFRFLINFCSFDLAAINFDWGWNVADFGGGVEILRILCGEVEILQSFFVSLTLWATLVLSGLQLVIFEKFRFNRGRNVSKKSQIENNFITKC